MTFASTVSLLGLLLVTQADGKDALPTGHTQWDGPSLR